MKNTLVFLLILALLVFILLVFRPVPIQSEADSIRISGIVDTIFEIGVLDVNLVLRETQKSYYINRGLEKGIKLEVFQRTLMGEEVILIHPDYWTPLDPFNRHKHITKLMHNDLTVYSELESEGPK
ncbi:MAG: hypothetical protein RIE58_09820 [Vicingaceae bacterium]